MKKYALFIGIDISKSWIDVSLSTAGKKEQMPHQQFSNDEKGFNRMLKWVTCFAQDQKIACKHWLFCMEHTGVYTMPLAYFLQSKQLDYVLESALRIYRSIGLKRGKDDKADSKDIARYAYLFKKELKPRPLPVQALLQLKSLLSLRERLVKKCQALQTPAKEMKQFMPVELCQSVLEHTEQIVKLCRQTIRKVEKQIKQIIQDNAEIKRLFELVTSVKGIGLICGLQIIIHTNCFKAFSEYRKFACYISIAPFEHRSGTSVNAPAKVSKLGHRKLKALFSNAACSAIQHDKELKAYYQRKVAQGKNKYSVLNAVKNKLISRAFAVVKRGTPYVEFNTYV